MSYVPLKIKPGADTVSTPLLLEAGWSRTLNIRFFQGKIQQNGFFQRLTSSKPRGVCRGLFPWADTSGIQYIAEGTTSELAVINNGNLYDITPYTGTIENLLTPLSTSNGLTTVTITDGSGQAVAGNFINIDATVSVSNLLLQGVYQIDSVGLGTYTITAPIVATSTVATGGATAKFDTTFGSATVVVTLPNHGMTVGEIFVVHISTNVGALTFYGQYVVQSVIDPSTFTITGPGNAAATATGSENAGLVRIEYLLPSGLASAGGLAGYGEMPYGLGPYGVGFQNDYLPLRQWSFGAWGSFLIASPTNGAIYVWMPENGFFSNPAIVITQAPAFNTWIFIAVSQQQIVALGAQDSSSGNQDPLLVRWCNVADYTDWTATVTNQAGSFRLPRGSRIVGGLQTPLQALVWTDLGLWSMQYIGATFVYGFNQVADGCGLIAARAVATLANAVIWMSQQGFFLYTGGSVTPIPCAIWDTIFKNLNTIQVDKITAAPNSAFTEVAFHMPSASGAGENDTVAKLNLIDGSWDYSNGADAQIYVRTAAYDQSVIGPAMGVDLNSILQQSETGVDGDGQPIVSSARTGWFRLSEGLFVMSVERIIPDFILNNSPTLTLSLYTANYPGDTPILASQVTVTSGTEYIIMRGRGRLGAFQIDATAPAMKGAFWRLGEPLVLAYPAGRR